MWREYVSPRPKNEELIARRTGRILHSVMSINRHPHFAISRNVDIHDVLAQIHSDGMMGSENRRQIVDR